MSPFPRIPRNEPIGPRPREWYHYSSSCAHSRRSCPRRCARRCANIGGGTCPGACSGRGRRTDCCCAGWRRCGGGGQRRGERAMGTGHYNEVDEYLEELKHDVHVREDLYESSSMT